MDDVHQLEYSRLDHGYYRLINGIGNKSRDPIERILKANSVNVVVLTRSECIISMVAVKSSRASR